MTEKPILFSAPMVRAILAGHKTQTRRIIKPQPGPGWSADCNPWNVDQLWVKETAIISPPNFCKQNDATHPNAPGGPRIVQYLATDEDREGADLFGLKASPSIFMPRWASRLTLHIIQLGLQCLQHITKAEALAEGITPDGFGGWSWNNAPDHISADTPQDAFRLLWSSINGPDSWTSNPAVWVITFRPEINSCK
jgi:hypothetical protein